MDLALESDIPTYSGGLGVLAGDSLRAAADLGTPMVGVSLLFRKGYFRQHLDECGNQTEADDVWAPEERLKEAAHRVTVTIEGRQVRIRAWEYPVTGARGHVVPVYLLDTHLPENAPEDRGWTDHLYGGDQRYRLVQELILGVGGVLMLRALGHRNVSTFHMNEGHSALLVLALFQEQVGRRHLTAASDVNKDAVREACVFTTHTPVPAGHDQFSWELVSHVLGAEHTSFLQAVGGLGDTLNMTLLALHCSRYVNAVALRHAEVSREMFPDYQIHAITNGVHVKTWLSTPFERLFDHHLSDWRLDNSNLRHAVSIPLREIDAAHIEAKRALLHEVTVRDGPDAEPGHIHHRLRPPRRHVQASRPDLLGPRAPPPADRPRRAGTVHLLGKGPPPRHRWQGCHPAHLRGKPRA